MTFGEIHTIKSFTIFCGCRCRQIYEVDQIEVDWTFTEITNKVLNVQFERKIMRGILKLVWTDDAKGDTKDLTLRKWRIAALDREKLKKFSEESYSEIS